MGAVQTPVVYKTLPVAEKTEKVSTPLVYTQPMIYNPAIKTPLTYTVPSVYNTALTTPVLSKMFPSLKTFTTPLVSHITKREAEADPPVVYTTAVQQPLVYNTAVQTPLVYNTPVHTPLLKT